MPSQEEIVARDILAALWQRCARAVNHSMTQTMWRGRYKATALDMAKAGVTVDRALAAHAAVTLAIGRPVYSLRVVQDELVRQQARSTPQRTVEEAPFVDDQFLENMSDGAGRAYLTKRA